MTKKGKLVVDLESGAVEHVTDTYREEVRVSQPPLDLGVLIDETGSMGPLSASVVTGVNDYIEKQRSLTNARLTLVLFDGDRFDVRCRAQGTSVVLPLSMADYLPLGMTNLYDATANLIKLMEQQQRPGANVMISILTDGLENASKEYTRGTIKDLIERKKRDGWTFAYMGAVDNPWDVAQSMGIPVTNTIHFSASPSGTAGAFNALSCSTANYATASASGSASVPVGNVFGGLTDAEDQAPS